MKKAFNPVIYVVLTIFVHLICFSDYHLDAEETLYISSELKKLTLWHILLAENPLPPGIEIEYITNEPKTTKNILDVRIQKWYEREDIRTSRDVILKEISSVKFIPMVSLLDDRSNVSTNFLRTLHIRKILKKHKISIIPISNLNPNYLTTTNSKALLVDNKTPFDPGYSLINRYFLKLQNPSSTIKNWFKNIKLYNYQNTREKTIIWMLAVGDVMLDREVDRLLLQPDGIKKVFGNTTSYLQDSDILFGNLECVASLKGHRLKSKSYTFHFNPHALKLLREVGFSYLSVTNNHTFDYGVTAFKDTLKNLKRYNLGFSGAGDNLKEASKPWVTHINNLTVKVLSVGAYPTERTGFSGKNYVAKEKKAGILWLNNYFFDLLKKKFQHESLNIVMVHGGVEWTSIPTPKQVKLYREIIDSGADLVIGSHPHFVQGFEKYRGKFIFYSLGNFLFPGMEETGYGDISIILRLGIYRQHVLYIIPTPVKLEGRKVRISTNSRIIKRFYKLSRIIEDRYPSTRE